MLDSPSRMISASLLGIVVISFLLDTRANPGGWVRRWPQAPDPRVADTIPDHTPSGTSLNERSTLAGALRRAQVAAAGFSPASRRSRDLRPAIVRLHSAPPPGAV